MERRLVITLHLDAFDLVDGAAWTTYDVHGKRLACEVYPGLGRALMAPEEAATLVLDRWAGVDRRQQRLDFPAS